MSREEPGGRPGPVRLLICDDHRLLTDALALLVQGDPTFELVSDPVGRGELALEVAARECPDVVLMDIELPGAMNGIEATRRIKERVPEASVVILTAHDSDHLLVEAVEAGASGCLSKSTPAGEVLESLRAAAQGEVLIDASLLSRVLRDVARARAERRAAEVALDQLTPREREILQLLAQGLRTDDVAGRLFISPQTVQTHVRNILAKLRVHSKLEAVAFAVRHGAVQV